MNDKIRVNQTNDAIQSVCLEVPIGNSQKQNINVHYAQIAITPEEDAFIEKALTVEPGSESECFSEDETLIKTASFDNGMEMDIKLCGVQYHEGESNTAWTEAVLFRTEGGRSYAGYVYTRRMPDGTVVPAFRIVTARGCSKTGLKPCEWMEIPE